MSVKLLHHTPLWIADKAIGKCWDKPTPDIVHPAPEGSYIEPEVVPGCNRNRIDRVANKNKHASTIEHLNYTFDITMSRACLQEYARHRMASLSVKSSRYTLKELKDATDEQLQDFIVLTGDSVIDASSIAALIGVRGNLKHGLPNDKVKYCLPECYKTSMIWTVNARSLQNFLSLRTSKAALWEIRDIAYAVYYQIPKAHRFLFAECVENSYNNK